MSSVKIKGPKSILQIKHPVISTNFELLTNYSGPINTFKGNSLFLKDRNCIINKM